MLSNWYTWTNLGKFTPRLEFSVRDCDPETGIVDDMSYPDTYTPEPIDLVTGDYMLGTYVPDFDTLWESAPNAVTETFALPDLKSVKDTLIMVCTLLGVVCTEQVYPEQARSTLKAGGTFIGGVPVLVMCHVILHPTNGVTMQVNVKSGRGDVSERVANSIQ